MRPIYAALAVALSFSASSAFAAAERQPNTEEKAAIEKALTAAGFSAWTSVKLDDDGKWEVDNAKSSDGKTYDVDLKVGTYEIIKKDLED